MIKSCLRVQNYDEKEVVEKRDKNKIKAASPFYHLPRKAKNNKNKGFNWSNTSLTSYFFFPFQIQTFSWNFRCWLSSTSALDVRIDSNKQPSLTQCILKYDGNRWQ
jgi:hypothetical protein